MNTYSASGKALKKIRSSHGLTQVELAKKVGVNSQFVSNAERGLCTLPVHALKKLVRKLGHREELSNAYYTDCVMKITRQCQQMFGGGK